MMKLLKSVLVAFFSLFFQRRIFAGRFFTKSSGGFVWAARAVWARNILRLGRTYPWPVALGCTISNPDNIEFHPDDLNNFQGTGIYFQNFGAKIYLGKGVYIAPNVGIITANHDIGDLDKHTPGADVRIGDGSWIGMNVVVMPGVVLGPRTVVAAGSVVTRSFVQGGVILAGAPARVLRATDGSSAASESPEHERS
jgi:acetyltransferase-like isoleucine patch superfamily enzyme